MTGTVRARIVGASLALSVVACAGGAAPRGEASVTASAGSRDAVPADVRAPAPADRAASRATAVRTCPAASQVRFARWATPDDLVLGAGPSGIPTTGAWLVPLGFRRVEAGAPPPGPLEAERLGELGLEAVPETLHVLRAGAAACPTRVAGYVADLIEDGVPNVRISAITSGCAPADPRAERGWVALVDPLACVLSLPVERGALRLVESDDGGTTLPAELVPVPAPYAAALRPLPCEAPCGTLWRLWVAEGAWNVAELWIDAITPGPPDEPCNWVDIDGYSALYVVLDDGVARELPFPDVDGFRPPMTLAGTLGDESGTRVVLLDDHSRWGAYELDETGAFGVGRTVDEYLPTEEDGLFRSNAPNCGP